MEQKSLVDRLPIFPQLLGDGKEDDIEQANAGCEAQRGGGLILPKCTKIRLCLSFGNEQKLDISANTIFS